MTAHVLQASDKKRVTESNYGRPSTVDLAAAQTQKAKKMVSQNFVGKFREKGCVQPHETQPLACSAVSVHGPFLVLLSLQIYFFSVDCVIKLRYDIVPKASTFVWGCMHISLRS